MCDMLGIEYPILSAGMGPTLIGETTGAPVELVVAVSEAGGLGVLGGSGFSVDELRDAIREIKKLTDKPYGGSTCFCLPGWPRTAPMGKDDVKVIPLKDVLETLPDAHKEWLRRVKEELELPDTDVMLKLNTTTMRPKEAIQVCIEERVPLFAAGLGNPGFMVEEAHAVGMKVLGITGNTKNARRIAEAGGWTCSWPRATRAAGTRAGSGPWPCFPRPLTQPATCPCWPLAASATAGDWPRPWPWDAWACGWGPASWQPWKAAAHPANKQRIWTAKTRAPG